MNDDNEFWYCYSTNLFRFLRATKGIPFICTGYHVETQKQFWQFRRTEELTQALDEYRQQDKTVKNFQFTSAK